MDVIPLDTPELGDRGYLVHDGAHALVVDPQRDIDRVEAKAREQGVTITHVAETHIHNDYVTGGHALARKHDATYLVAAAEQVAFDRHPVHPGDTVAVGTMTVTALATPGHTEHHLAYVVDHDGRQAIFSGGSLLHGSVGRTDLVDPTRTEELTRAQYHSARTLADRAHPDATLHPTHGFGSFCSSGPTRTAHTSTIAEQLRVNHALTDDETEFVATLIANLTAYPSYYAHMAPLNRIGPAEPDLTVPRPLSPGELSRRLDAGEWVVDLRHRVAFATSHLRGAISVEYGRHFTTYLGWTLPWGDPVTLIGAPDDVTAAIRDLSRIGLDHPDVGADADAGHPTSSYRRATWPELRTRLTDPRPLTVLDVRRDDERATTAVPRSLHIPLPRLVSTMDSLPNHEIWVHCASGYRAGIAASLLDRAGHHVVHVDDDWPDTATP
ncbi:MBL fold metallo-hydrolase [Actinosynnema sp. NPDC020468]|uniref:MBL fold metallo-hydrolase n=1 Tax=Actinosynnema sp. NPDC020468 TaxID=3154488 RepID=UPI00340FC13C